MYNAGNYDMAVIGAGHAGIEAALAGSRLGLRVICFTINLDAVGNMPCNPSIGGTAKGHLVREIDALGGQMAKSADKTSIQLRMLNRGKGPAVHSLRAQSDRLAYRHLMKQTLENQQNLVLRQAEVIDIGVSDGRVCSVTTATGGVYHVRAVVLCSGTYLDGRVIVGELTASSGPDGLSAAIGLGARLSSLGLDMRRFKTGTPPRISLNTVDLSKFEVQPGDEDVYPFSFESEHPPVNSAVCWLNWTTEQTHDIIRANLSRSPLYSGVISGVGPRYCPSIEDKIVKFADKPRHPLFLEPTGENSAEMYLQGMSTSLPEDVQVAMLHSVPGMENAEIMRPGYAIEYDCINPLELYPTLEIKKIGGLYGAGQFCGTSGYEEAAALGLVAGINASMKILGREQIVFDRANSYIGTMIDDLVTKGVTEPYRIMTSRSEYRLILRQDNADLRLCHIGHGVGLISDERYRRCLDKYERIEDEIKRVSKVVVPPSDLLNELLVSRESAPVSSGVRLYDLIKRPQLDYKSLAPFDPDRQELTLDIQSAVEISIKYEGYISRQRSQVQQFGRMEAHRLPDDIDYASIAGLRIEARQYLTKVRPASLGHASRIPGVNPADIAALIIWLQSRKHAEMTSEKSGEAHE